jgi:PAS domain S-box-containing protein
MAPSFSPEHADKELRRMMNTEKEDDPFDRAGIGKAELFAAIEQAADGIVITDRRGTIRYVNPAFSRITLYSKEDALGQNPRILKSGSQSKEFYNELWRTISAGRVWSGEIINRRKDDTVYTEEMSIAPVRAGSGEIASYIAIKQDISKRREAEDAQRFLAAVVQYSGDAITAYTPGGTILTWNRGAETIFGYAAE